MGTIPIEWNEFKGVIDEINTACSGAFPPWMRICPVATMAVGFMMFVLGGFLSVQGSSNLAMPVIGFVLCFLSVFSLFLCSSQGNAALLTNLRQTLSGLNARYSSRLPRIDFQLHESRHLELFNRSDASGMKGMKVRSVKDYTLVIQVLGSAGERIIPTPDIVMAQAFQGASALPQQQMYDINGVPMKR